MEIGRDFFRRTFGYDAAAAFPTLGAKMDNPVSGLDHVEVVLDDDERASTVDELAEGGEELGDIVKMQARGGLVKDVENAAGLGGLGLWR